jgi:hypothetical protein
MATRRRSTGLTTVQVLPTGSFWLARQPATQGGLYDSGLLPAGTLSTGVDGLPIDGSTVYVRLSYTVGSVTNNEDYSYTAYSPSTTPEITGPVPGSTLVSDTVTFDWTNNSTGVTAWVLKVGTTPGGNNLYQSTVLDGATLSHTVSGLPTDSSLLHVTLRWKVGASPGMGTGFIYTAAAGGGSPGVPGISSPATGSTLGSDTVVFSWNDNDADVSDCQLRLVPLWVTTVCMIAVR